MASLAEQEKELFNKFHPMPNGPERAALYKDWKKIYDTLPASKKQQPAAEG